MEPIEREIEERKALMLRWADEADHLAASKAGLSHDEQLKIDLQVSTLRYKIHCGEWALEDLEAVAAEGRSLRRERPPLPNARTLGVVERQRIERETRARLVATLKASRDMEVHVHVGRTTDEKGNPQIAIHVGPRRTFEGDDQ